MVVKKSIILKESELVNLVEDIVKGIMEQKAGVFDLGYETEDSTWDKIWYGTRDALSWLSLISAYPHPYAKVIGLVAGVIAGAMYASEDEWGAAGMFWLFEALPYIKFGKLFKLKGGKAITVLRPGQLKKVMDAIVAGAEINKIIKMPGGEAVLRVLREHGDELINVYKNGLSNVNYKQLKKLSTKITSPKQFKEYIKSGGKLSDELTELGWDKFSKLKELVSTMGEVELKGLQLMVNRAKLLVKTTAEFGSYLALAMFVSRIIDVVVVERTINNTKNPWESRKQGKDVYYSYDDIMLDELWNENPVLLLKAWKDGKQFPRVPAVPVDVSMSKDDYMDKGGISGMEKKEIIYNPNPGGGWRPELGIWMPDKYDLRFMDEYFREMNETMGTIFKLFESGEITEKEAKERVEKEIGVDL